MLNWKDVFKKKAPREPFFMWKFGAVSVLSFFIQKSRMCLFIEAK